MAFGGSRAAYLARCRLGGYKGGPKRAAFWRVLGFPNLERAPAARTNKRKQRQLEEWKQQELKRTPFALLDDPPAELVAVKRPRRPRAK